MKKLLQSLFILLFVASAAMAQERTITGTVSSQDDGLPLPGVGVKVKGSSTGVSTDASGKYSIRVNSGATLVFTSIGFASKEVVVGTRTTISVQLSSESRALDEVVIQVPYGTVKKSAFTGSEITVGSAELSKTQLTSVTRALEGRVSGIVATNGGGQPGAGASVRVRGVTSVNAGNSPLYVVDGAVYNGSISALNNDDIENITVLKDAAATSLYGARAAAGVIMIQTKQGKKGEASIKANIRTGMMNRGIPQYDLISTKDYYEMMWEATRNRLQYASGQTPTVAGQNASAQLTGASGLVYNAYNVPGNQLVDPVTGKLNPNAKLLWDDNWNDVLFQDALRQDYNVSISGASDKSDYYISGGYLNEEGVTKFTEYNRYNLRVNVNTQARPWLKSGLSMDAARSYQRNNVNGGTATTNPFYYSTMMGPIYPVWQRDASGNFVTDLATGKPALDWGVASQMGARPYAPNSNLLGSLDLDDRSSRVINVNTNTYLEATFLKDFKFRPSFSATLYDANGTTFQNSLYGDAFNVAGRSTKSNSRQFTYTFNQVLSYAKTINEDHRISVLAGHESYAFKTNGVSATRTGFPFPGNSELAPAAVAEASSSSEDNHKIESYFSKVDYEFQSKYYLSGSFRRDASSRFYADSRWGNFFSVGAAWRISQESFLKGVSWINELKLRANYGEVGNEDLGSDWYAWQALYDLGWNNVGYPGATVLSLPNYTLSWEKNASTNIGIDFSLFKNRLQGSIEWYNKISDNLLFNVPLAPSTGITSINDNVGAMFNRGLDVNLGYEAVKQDKFGWRVDLNLTHFKNQITKLPQTEIISGTKKMMVGKSIYDFWIKEYAGVDPATGLALFYQDVLGTDGLPTGARTTTSNFSTGSFYYHGSAIPDLTGGISNSFRYGNLDLSFMFTFQLGGTFYDSNYATLMHVGSYGSNWHKDILNRWTTPGQVTDIPRVQNALANQSGASTRYLFDADYLNLKNITLGYTLPKNWVNSVGIKNARLVGNVDNVYLWQKGKKGMNPQGSFNGTTDFIYPVMRTFTLGLSVNL